MFDHILPATEITPAANALRGIMSMLSEDCYCAGWMMGLEISLWELMMQDGGSYGMGLVGEEDAAQLLWLAYEAGGWWYWPEKDGKLLTDEEQFTDLASWQTEYEAYHAWSCDFQRQLHRLVTRQDVTDA